MTTTTTQTMQETYDATRKRRNVLEDLVNAAAWLANDLIDVLLKVAADAEPHPVMASDLSERIREAEIRLELLREMNRQ